MARPTKRPHRPAGVHIFWRGGKLNNIQKWQVRKYIQKLEDTVADYEKKTDQPSTSEESK